MRSGYTIRQCLATVFHPRAILHKMRLAADDLASNPIPTDGMSICHTTPEQRRPSRIRRDHMETVLAISHSSILTTVRSGIEATDCNKDRSTINMDCDRDCIEDSTKENMITTVQQPTVNQQPTSQQFTTIRLPSVQRFTVPPTASAQSPPPPLQQLHIEPPDHHNAGSKVPTQTTTTRQKTTAEPQQHATRSRAKHGRT